MKEVDHNNLTLLDAMITDVIHELPLEARVSVANLADKEIRLLELVLGKYLKYRLDQLNESGNEKLKQECIAISGKDSLNDVEAATVILKEL